MAGVFLSIVLLVLSHVVGVVFGHGVGLMFPGVTLRSEYVRRVMRGLIFGGATIIVFVYLMGWFAKPVHPAFLAVSVGTFLVLALSNHSRVKAAMRAQRSNAAVHMKLAELSRTRLVQDLAAVGGALISALVAYRRAV